MKSKVAHFTKALKHKTQTYVPAFGYGLPVAGDLFLILHLIKMDNLTNRKHPVDPKYTTYIYHPS